MKKQLRSAQARELLDKRFAEIGPAGPLRAPVNGWIKAIRSALGMNTAQLAKRMRISQPTLTEIEMSEAKGSIELATLRRAAQALDCKLVYILVPNKPLEVIVRERALAFIRRRVRPIEHSMLLEDQSVKGQDVEPRIDDVIRETSPHLFWE